MKHENNVPETTDIALCKASYRRELLSILYLGNSPMFLPDIADQITIWKTGDPAEQHRQKRLQIYLSLYHDHLPPLIEAGLLEYRQEEDMVGLGPSSHQYKSEVLQSTVESMDELLQAEAQAFNATNRARTHE